MSPEQITDGAITRRIRHLRGRRGDVRAVHRVQAFRGETLQSVMYKIVSVPTPPSCAWNFETLSSGTALEHLQGARRDRFASAGEGPDRPIRERLEMANALSDVRTRVLDGQDAVRSASFRASVARVMADAPESKTRRTRRRLIGARRWSGRCSRWRAVIVTVVRAPEQRASRPIAAAPSASPPAATSIAVTPPSQPQTPPVTPTQAPSAARQSPAPPPATKSIPRQRRRPRSSGFSARCNQRRSTRAGAPRTLARPPRNSTAATHTTRWRARSCFRARPRRPAITSIRRLTSWSAAERTARLATSATAGESRARRSAQAAGRTSVAAVTTAPPAATPVIQPPAAQSLPAPAAGQSVGRHQRGRRDATPAHSNHATSPPSAARTRASRRRRRRGGSSSSRRFARLRVTIAVSGLDVSGATPTRSSSGHTTTSPTRAKSEHQPVSFQASFRREGTVWQLVSVH